MRFFALAVLVFWTTAISAADTRSIKVSAMSEIKVAPDEVVLQLAVYTRDEKLLIAKSENDRVAAAVIELTRKHSIAEADVKVTDLDVSPDYGEYGRRRTSKPLAYDFTRSIEVRVTDFTTIEPFLSDAFEAGLSHVSSLHFRVSNQREHQVEARQLAVKYATEKAEHLTKLTGMKLGAPIRIEEGVERNWDAGGFGGGFSANYVPADGENVPNRGTGATEFVAFQDPEKPKATQIPLAPGQIKLSAEVTVEFEMLPAAD